MVAKEQIGHLPALRATAAVGAGGDVSRRNIRRFPSSPGVYLMQDKEGRIVYVGKAVSLRQRLLSYLAKPQASLKTALMLAYARRVDIIETSSEHEALLLEADLIKRFQPRFNVCFKDDKSYPVIKITREEYPRVAISRKRRGEEAADIFGPYTNAKVLKRALSMLRKSFPFCTCRSFPKRACLNYHLGICAGPCVKKKSKKRYRRMIRALEDFLTKPDDDLIAELSLRMRELARRERFEEAARVRDRLEALSLFASLKKSGGREAAGQTNALFQPAAAGLSAEAAAGADVEEGPREDAERIGLKKDPRRIETFDVSSIQGSYTVGSMVSFFDGRPDKNRYRRFRIRTAPGWDDYAMMQEIVRRRYRHVAEGRLKKPDLVVIDGGRGHLEAAFNVLQALHLRIPIIAIAKREDLIYTINRREPVRLGRGAQLLRLIQRCRDEAHRFAGSYHRLLRKKGAYGDS